MRSEKQIISNWTSDYSKPLVTVCCATYNHELYIEDALDGFLAQKTTFPFEIIVHDDASTDNTVDIIKKYHDEYPNIIIPYIQNENQMSKGGFKPSAYMAERARGKYLAFCEGDDYWIDEDKLAIQVRVLEEHKDINLCVHDASVIEMSEINSGYSFPKRVSREYVIPYEEIFRVKGQFCPTSSMLVRSKMMRNLPDFFFIAPVGDFYIEALSGRNGIYYIPRKMSVYRRNTRGSWSSVITRDRHTIIDFCIRSKSTLASLKEFIGMPQSKYIIYKQHDNYMRLIRQYYKTKQYGRVYHAMGDWFELVMEYMLENILRRK
jgi:glycosyltransferase involved in cell wall biosynthesis